LFKKNNLVYNLGVRSFLKSHRPMVHNYENSIEKYRPFIDLLLNYVESWQE